MADRAWADGSPQAAPSKFAPGATCQLIDFRVAVAGGARIPLAYHFRERCVAGRRERRGPWAPVSTMAALLSAQGDGAGAVLNLGGVGEYHGPHGRRHPVRFDTGTCHGPSMKRRGAWGKAPLMWAVCVCRRWPGRRLTGASCWDHDWSGRNSAKSLDRYRFSMPAWFARPARFEDGAAT